MKIVGLEIKKVEIGKFFPKESKVELKISYNDGSDREIFNIVDVKDTQQAAESIIGNLKKIIKNLHKQEENEGPIMGTFLNIVIKGEDEFIRETAKFIETIGIKMEEINNKKDAEGYLDIIRDFKNLKLEF